MLSVLLILFFLLMVFACLGVARTDLFSAVVNACLRIVNSSTVQLEDVLLAYLVLFNRADRV